MEEQFTPEKGTQMRHIPSGDIFTVQRRTRLANGSVKLNSRYLLEDCSLSLLRSDELTTLLEIVDCILLGQESIELLSALDPEHKKTLWVELSEEQKVGLIQLGRAV